MEHEPMQIRAATASDRDAIRAVTLAAYGEYANLMPPQMWAQYRQNILATLADIGTAEQIVAEQESAILGTVLLYPPVAAAYANVAAPPAWPEVRLLAVAPAARGQGIGQALMQECMRRARQSGATTLGLHTMDVMQSAMRLYTHMGFQRAPERDFHPAAGVVVKGFALPLA
jgi:GNAT superfamily N-acetyltransferase